MAGFFGLFIIALLRFTGMQKIPPISTHPWAQMKPWKVVRLTSDTCDVKGLKNLISTNPKAFIWLDVRRSATQWEIVCPEKTLYEIVKEQPSSFTLEQALPLVKNQGVIFNGRVREPLSSGEFLRILTEWAPDKTDIGIASASQGWLHDLRKKRPQWMFAADVATWTKLKLFSMIGAEPALELGADFFVTSLSPNDPNAFTAASAKEIARRKKPLLLEWDGEGEPSAEWSPSVHGILTKRPKNSSIDTFLQKMAE
jgi:hypothetical protein